MKILVNVALTLLLNTNKIFYSISSVVILQRQDCQIPAAAVVAVAAAVAMSCPH